MSGILNNPQINWDVASSTKLLVNSYEDICLWSHRLCTEISIYQLLGPGDKMPSLWTPQTLSSFGSLQSYLFIWLCILCYYICVQTSMMFLEDLDYISSSPTDLKSPNVLSLVYSTERCFIRLMRRNTWRIPGQKRSLRFLWKQQEGNSYGGGS